MISENIHIYKDNNNIKYIIDRLRLNCIVVNALLLFIVQKNVSQMILADRTVLYRLLASYCLSVCLSVTLCTVATVAKHYIL